jgi:hypothetical protein
MPLPVDPLDHVLGRWFAQPNTQPLPLSQLKYFIERLLLRGAQPFPEGRVGLGNSTGGHCLIYPSAGAQSFHIRLQVVP